MVAFHVTLATNLFQARVLLLNGIITAEHALSFFSMFHRAFFNSI